MTSKFSRFLHLERSRGERPKPEEPSPLQSGGRFEALAQRGEAPQGAEVPEAHLERFRGEAPLALADAPKEAEHFPRCARCESENGRYVHACGVCGADLNTPQQREYNERLRQTRQAQEREQEQAAAEWRLQAEAREQEALAERARLIEKLRSEPWGKGTAIASSKGRALGLVLLTRIPSRAVRWGVGAGLFLLPLLFLRYGSPKLKMLGGVLVFLLLVLFLPPAVLTSRARRF
jgi:hypothetical protein